MMREIRIDIVKGLAIIIILMNHLSLAMQFYGLRGPVIPTPTRYGYSSAGELFVIMSGYMVGMVYLRRDNPGRAILARARTLYLYNLGLFAAAFPVAYAMTADERDYWNLESLVQNPLAATLKFATFMDSPLLLNVLQLYVILMIATPLALIAYRKSPWLLVGLSCLLYVAVITARLIDPAGDMPTGSTFNPLTWQLLFFVSMVLGAQRAHTALFDHFQKRWVSIVAVIAIIAIAAVIRKLMNDSDIHFHRALTSKHDLGPIRLVHAALMVGFYAGLLVLARVIVHVIPFRVLAAIGRHSLNCFILGVVLTYGFALLWDRSDWGYAAYLLLCGIGVVITIAGAYFWDHRKTHARVGSAGAAFVTSQ